MRFEPRTPDASVNVDPRTPLREFVTLSVAVTIGVLVVLLVAFRIVDLALVLVPPEREAELFPDIDLDGQEPLDADDPVQRRAGELLHALVDQWEAAPYAFELERLARDEPNAFALPGGTIVVSDGLLAAVGSQNELAFVLAHELGHYANRDHLRALGRGFAVALIGTAFGLPVGTDLPAVVSVLTQRGFARRQELAADAFGLALVQERYGHVDGALDLFPRLDATGPRAPAYFSTHPASTARIGRLVDLACERGWPLDGPTELMPAGEDGTITTRHYGAVPEGSGAAGAMPEPSCEPDDG